MTMFSPVVVVDGTGPMATIVAPGPFARALRQGTITETDNPRVWRFTGGKGLRPLSGAEKRSLYLAEQAKK